MANVNDFINQSKIPDTIKFLHNYEGDEKTLMHWIESVETVLGLYQQLQNDPIYVVWLSAIRAKIIGRANEALITQNVPNEWNRIRDRLILVFGDRRDLSTLCQGISNLCQEKKSLEDFYNEVTSLNTDISQKVRQEATYNGHHVAVMHFVEMLTRNAFIDGLNHPYSLYTRNYRPETLEQAFRAAQEQMLADARRKDRFPSLSRDNSQRRNNQRFQRGNQAQSSQNPPRNSGGQNDSRNFNENFAPRPQTHQNDSRNFNAKFSPRSQANHQNSFQNSRGFSGNFQQNSPRAYQNQNATPMEVDPSTRSRLSRKSLPRDQQLAIAEQENIDEVENETFAESEEECYDERNFHLAFPINPTG